MTTSSMDGEALAAIRRANAMLNEAGHTWLTFLGNHAAADSGPEEMKNYAPTSDQVRQAFVELANAHMSVEFKLFMNNCRTEFENDGYLNQFKRAKLFDAVRRARAGQGIL